MNIKCTRNRPHLLVVIHVDGGGGDGGGGGAWRPLAFSITLCVALNILLKASLKGIMYYDGPPVIGVCFGPNL